VISVHIIPDTRQDNQPDQIKLFALQVFVDSSINQRYVPIHRLDNLELVPGERQRCFAHFGAVKSSIFWVSEKRFIKWGCGLVV
jgi:hypothetical protein